MTNRKPGRPSSGFRTSRKKKTRSNSAAKFDDKSPYAEYLPKRFRQWDPVEQVY